MLSLGFAGDLNLAGVNRYGREYLEQTYATCATLTSQAELSIVNLECCIVPAGEHSAPMAIPNDICHDLERSGFGVVCLANNHVRDFGPDALMFTQQFLQSRSLATVGAGRDIETAMRPLLIEQAGKRIAVLNVTDATHYKATKRSAGVAPLSRRGLKRAIRALLNEADLIIVSIHADLEFTNSPAPWKVSLSRQLIRWGADIVVHHHAHTLQGIESYRGGLIAYSLGNFVFPVHGSKYMSGREGKIDESVFLRVFVDFSPSGEKTIAHDVVPLLIDETNLTVVAQQDKAAAIRDDLARYTELLQRPRELRRAYLRHSLQHARALAFGTYYGLRQDGFAGAWSFFRTHIGTQMHRNWMRGIATLGRF